MTLGNYVRIQNARGVGPKKLSAILEKLSLTGRTIDQLFAMPASEIGKVFSLPAKLAESIATSTESSPELTKQLERKNVRVLVQGTAEYPQRIAKLLGKDAPPLFYTWGNLDLITKPSVGFCGSRSVTPKGIDVTHDTASQIAALGWVVVSGHAQGVDVTAHQTALECGGYTIIVAPEGILNFELRQNLRQIAAPERVLVVSEFPPTAKWSVGNAMTRNKTILALSDAMILIESRLEGGTFEAGKAALDLKVPLYVAEYQLPGNSAEGNVFFLNKGATAIRKSRETGKANISTLIDVVRSKHSDITPINTNAISTSRTNSHMKYMTSAEVRQGFLDFFEEMHHQPVASSSLVPGNDPTLLFTNAGMVQFKDVFLGIDKRPYNRATTSQKCMRVSGKHNDLENVGPSPRHHTFFEMLGNFSFGDYFKRDACRFAYDLLTRVYGLPPERLYFTVHTSDDEAFDIWTKEIGVPATHVHRLGDKSNFWQMGDTGPCGPCSEIFWDWDPSGGTDYETIAREHVADNGRLFEVWNLVFMQYNQNADGTREPLERTGVDTGMGLERIVSVLQEVRSNYQTDLFLPIIARIRELNGATQEQYAADSVPYHVIADHVRAASFLIADGVTPGSKDRGYICRMVIRRAARFGKKIGFDQPFLADVADTLIEVMGGHYSELKERRETIRKAITQEEVRFRRTLDRGIAELDSMLAETTTHGMLPGDKAFFLKGTLGLPFEVTRDIAQELGYKVDEEGFYAAQREHELASGADKPMGTINIQALYGDTLADLKARGVLGASGVEYDPYSGTERQGRLVTILRDGLAVEAAEVGDRVEVVLDKTCFYVESGGQVSDTGTIRGQGWTIDIEDVRRPVGGLVIHIGEVVEGTVKVNSEATASVDAPRRMDIMRNHTATHLLHAQLRAVLGNHVQQRGSLVAPDRLRFDFSHDAPLTDEELSAIVANINAAIMADMPVKTVEKDLATARSEGAMALFGEKYGDRVRTVTIDDHGQRYSYELCGGTHVKDTAVIGPFVVTNEGSVAQGIRRIEALTGTGAQRYIGHQRQMLHLAANALGTTPDSVNARINAMRDELATMRRENDRLRRQVARLEFEQLYNQRQMINDVPVLIARVEATSADTLREMTDWFRDKAKSGVIVLGSVNNDKPQLIASVTDDLTKRVHAGNLIKAIAPIVGGGGGGRPNMAQAGGKDAGKLDAALAQAREVIAQGLA